MDVQGYGCGVQTFIPKYLIDDINLMRFDQEVDAFNEHTNTLAYEYSDTFDGLEKISMAFAMYVKGVSAKAPERRVLLLNLVAHGIAFLCSQDYTHTDKDKDAELQRIIHLAESGNINQKLLPSKEVVKGMFDEVGQH